jgi:hypothetical protein
LGAFLKLWQKEVLAAVIYCLKTIWIIFRIRTQVQRNYPLKVCNIQYLILFKTPANRARAFGRGFVLNGKKDIKPGKIFGYFYIIFQQII